MSDRAGPDGAVVYIGNFELPDRNAAAHRVRGNARIFRDLGYRVILVGVSKQMRTDQWLEAVQSDEENIEAYQVPYPSGTVDWIRRITSRRTLTEVVDRAEINRLGMSICYNYPAIAQYRVAQATRRLGGVAVADCTEWYGQLKNTSPAALVKNLDTPLRMYAVNRSMDALITTSPFITEFYRQTQKPIVELPTIIPVSRNQVAPSAGNSAAKKLVFAGSGFDPALAPKGKEGLKDRLDWVLELLAHAQRRGARFEADLYGVNREDYLVLVPSHEEVLAELGEAVRFHGRVPHSELLQNIADADFSIFMRKKTRVTMAGFASKFSESVAYGTPAITNRLPSTERFMEEGRTGFFLDLSDIEQAGEKLAEILSLPRERILKMKRYCAQSRMFDHTRYIEPVRRWLQELGGIRT